MSVYPPSTATRGRPLVCMQCEQLSGCAVAPLRTPHPLQDFAMSSPDKRCQQCIGQAPCGPNLDAHFAKMSHETVMSQTPKCIVAA
eukprot:4767776-Amphidinium_carterae.1